jgi:hypothetical protein
VWTHTEVQQAIGSDHLEELVLKNYQAGESQTVREAALFYFIGALPLTDWLEDQPLRDERGFILTGPHVIASGQPKTWRVSRDPFLLETSVPACSRPETFATGPASVSSPPSVRARSPSCHSGSTASRSGSGSTPPANADPQEPGLLASRAWSNIR